jgi:hypothetical protein
MLVISNDVWISSRVASGQVDRVMTRISDAMAAGNMWRGADLSAKMSEQNRELGGRPLVRRTNAMRSSKRPQGIE